MKEVLEVNTRKLSLQAAETPSMHLVADVADTAEELEEVGLAVRQSGLLEVAAAQERLLALGAGKVIHVPAGLGSH